MAYLSKGYTIQPNSDAVERTNPSNATAGFVGVRMLLQAGLINLGMPPLFRVSILAGSTSTHKTSLLTFARHAPGHESHITAAEDGCFHEFLPELSRGRR